MIDKILKTEQVEVDIQDRGTHSVLYVNIDGITVLRLQTPKKVKVNKTR